MTDVGMLGRADIADIAVIGLLGRKGSGKSTVARYLVDRYGAQVISFATPLKDMTHEFIVRLGALHGGVRLGRTSPFDTIEYARDHLYSYEHKEWIVFTGEAGRCQGLCTLRWLMMTLGTEMCRQHLGANVWVNAALGSMQRRRWAGQRLFVIDDVRFLNEVEMIRANNGVIIKLTCTDDPVPAGQVHASEDVDSISAHLIDEAVASHRSPNSDHLLHEFSQALERMFDASVADQPSDVCRARAAVRAALQSPRG